MNCGVGCIPGSDPTLLQLWHRPAATAWIGALAWEFPYATGGHEKTKDTQKDLPCVPRSPKIILLF